MMVSCRSVGTDSVSCYCERNIFKIHELYARFRLEITFTGRTVGIVAKSSKTLQDALSAVMQKHNLKPQDATVTMVSECSSVRDTSRDVLGYF